MLNPKNKRMKKSLLLFSFALAATMVNSQTIEYSTELLYQPSGDGVMVVRQITQAGPGNETKTIIGDYKGIMVIPETAPDGTKVVAIDDFAFKDCKELTEITIPASVTQSGKQAFYGCKSLKTLTLEDSDAEIRFIEDADDWVTTRYWEFTALEDAYIGRNYQHVKENGEQADPFGEPFSYNGTLKNVVFGDKVTRINNSAFMADTLLQSITLGTGLVTIGNGAFEGCKELISKLHFPSTLKTIGAEAFYGAPISEMVIPASVEEIGDYGLAIPALKKVVIEDGETTLKIGMNGYGPMFSGSASEQGMTMEEAYLGRNVESALFQSNSTIKSIVIGDLVTELPADYCVGCARLEKIVLGRGLERIGNTAIAAYWEETSSLKEIVSRATTPPVCGVDVFNNVNKQTCKLYVPGTSIDAYKSADQWKDFFQIEPMGINAAEADTFTYKEVFSLSGQRLETPQSGISIWRMSDGSVRKVLR